MKGLSQILVALGVNAVPGAGWWFDQWSSGTILALYWFESLLAALLVAARIALHRRWHPCAGHVAYRVRQTESRTPRAPFLRYFLTVSLTFSLAHGFFLAVLFALLTANGHAASASVNWAEVRTGVEVIGSLLVAGFLTDLYGLRQRKFAWIERVADVSLSRVLVVHLTLIFGLAAVAFTGANRAFFAVFLALKTLNDLAVVLPQWDPDRPPGWLCWLMDRVPNVQQGKKTGPKTFAEFWVADKAAEVARREAHERPI